MTDTIPEFVSRELPNGEWCRFRILEMREVVAMCNDAFEIERTAVLRDLEEINAPAAVRMDRLDACRRAHNTIGQLFRYAITPTGTMDIIGRGAERKIDARLLDLRKLTELALEILGVPTKEADEDTEEHERPFERETGEKSDRSLPTSTPASETPYV